MSEAMWMIIILSYLFMVFSMLGWVLELFFRRFISMKKWINPGLLKGPYLPIYGTGVVCLYVFIHIMKSFEGYFAASWLFDLSVIVGIGALMTLIELIGGLIFIRGMKVRLWDYSKRWGNYKGIICPLYSLIWTLAGALFYYALFEPLNNMVYSFITLDWLLFAVLLVGVFFGIFIADFCESVQLVSKVEKLAKEMRMEVDWDRLKSEIREELKSKSLKTSFLSPFNTPYGIAAHMKMHFEGKRRNKKD